MSDDTQAIKCTECGKRVGTRNCAPCVASKPVPSNFAEVAHLPMVELRDMFSKRHGTLMRWRIEVGYVTMDRWTEDDIKALRDNFDTMTWAQIARRIGRSTDATKAKARSLGLKKPRAKRRPADYRKRGLHSTRVVSGAESIAAEAAEYLRSKAATYRCDAKGRCDEKGDHWIYGVTLNTDEELIARAVKMRWRRDAWRELAAA